MPVFVANEAFREVQVLPEALGSVGIQLISTIEVKKYLIFDYVMLYFCLEPPNIQIFDYFLSGKSETFFHY